MPGFDPWPALALSSLGLPHAASKLSRVCDYGTDLDPPSACIREGCLTDADPTVQDRRQAEDRRTLHLLSQHDRD